MFYVHECKVIANCENTVRVRVCSGFCGHARLDTLMVRACPICSVTSHVVLGPLTARVSQLPVRVSQLLYCSTVLQLTQTVLLIHCVILAVLTVGLVFAVVANPANPCTPPLCRRLSGCCSHLPTTCISYQQLDRALFVSSRYCTLVARPRSGDLRVFFHRCI